MTVSIFDAEDPITDSDIKRLEKQLNVDLPEDYRDFLLQHNGGRPEPNVFSLTDESLKTTEDTIAWFLCINDNDVKDISETLAALRGRILDNLLPIAMDPFGNYICVATSGPNRGRIYLWDHERELSTSSVYFLSLSFAELLSGLRTLEPRHICATSHGLFGLRTTKA